MNNQDPSYELREEPIIRTVGYLYQEFLGASSEMSSQALFKAYAMLTDEQKIAFLLAGGTERLFQWQQQYHQTRPDPGTGQLPAFC